MSYRKEFDLFPAFTELDPQQQSYFFDYARDKALFHVDTLYYRVYIRNDSNENEDVNDLINELRDLKHMKTTHPESVINFNGLTVELGKYDRYIYRLSCGEDYDVFFTPVIPTPETPRAVVQLRSRSLVLNGEMKTLCKSFAWLENFLEQRGLSVDSIAENRIDYAYHTNLIQNPYKKFADHNLLKHMRCNMTRSRTYGEIIDNEMIYFKEHHVDVDKIKNIRGSKMDISYFSIGSQKSNNVFIRIYNKTQEVIEQNYKSFFLERWLEHKLINRYDYFVYQRAFVYESYRIGVLRGRLEWYLEYGTNPEILEELQKVRDSCVNNSSNVKRLEEVVNKYLPPVTLIMNVEFQTKRKFYKDCENCIMDWGYAPEDWLRYQTSAYFQNNPLARIFYIYNMRKAICKYLTHKTLRFVKDKNVKEEEPEGWWRRIQQCVVDANCKCQVDLYRKREASIDKQRAKRRLLSSVAYLGAIYSLDSKSNDDKRGFVEDLADVLCSLNDNDIYRHGFYGFAPDPVTGREFDVSLEQKYEYSTFKKRKKQSLKSIYKNNKKESEKTI